MNAKEFAEIKCAVDLAINQIVEKGCDDIFKPPVFSTSLEHQIISANVADFASEARKQAIKFIKNANLETDKIGEVRKSLVVKDQYTFRQVCWLDPFDSVKYLALCVLLFKDIEAARIPKAKGVIHSHRVSDIEGELFDRNFGYDSFRARSGELSRQYMGKWKIVTDVSNFFDRIGNHSLENHLLNIGCNKKYTTLLREMLYYWSGDRRSYGLPVGSDASRIVSEAVLIDIDNRLIEENIPFVRYVDDFRIFAETRSQAYQFMQRLTSLLAEEGLSVNSKKTKIFEVVDESELHVEVAIPGGEHETLDLEKKIEVKAVRTVSGRSSISKFYKKPGKEALEKIKKHTRDEIFAGLDEATAEEEEEIIKLAVKYFVYVEQDAEILRQLIDRKVTTVFYIVDALVKEVDRIDPNVRNAAKTALLKAIDVHAAAYPFIIPLLRLTATEGYHDSSVVSPVVDAHKINDNILFFREAVTLGFGRLDRARIRMLALEVFNAVPACVQRAIYHAVKNHDGLSEAEKNPLLKNMRQGPEDWFIRRM